MMLQDQHMQKPQEVLVKRLYENTVSDYLQTTNVDFLDMFLTAKHLEGVHITVENIFHRLTCNAKDVTIKERWRCILWEKQQQ